MPRPTHCACGQSLQTLTVRAGRARRLLFYCRCGWNAYFEQTATLDLLIERREPHPAQLERRAS